MTANSQVVLMRSNKLMRANKAFISQRMKLGLYLMHNEKSTRSSVLEQGVPNEQSLMYINSVVRQIEKVKGTQ